MGFEKWKVKRIDDTDIEILDGDRGKNYPNKKELLQTGHTLFLSNKNLHGDKLSVDFGEYISKEKDELLRKGKLVRNDIVMSTRGSVGNIGYYHQAIHVNNIRINSGMVIFRNKDKEIINDYLYHLLKSPYCKNQYIELTSGSVQNQLPIRDLKSLRLLIPSIEEQNEIVFILNSLESKIENNNSVISHLEQLAQTLFKRWFVDFEFPNENGEPYKSSGGEMVESELGMVPEGWKVESFGQITTVGSGKRPKMRNEVINDEVNIPVIGASKIMGYTNEALYDEPIVVMGRVGTHGVIQRFNQPCWPSDNTLVMKSDYLEYVYQFLSTVDYKSLNRGSTQPLITQRDINGLKIASAPETLMLAFENEQTVFTSVIRAKELEIKTLTKLRDTLLPKLLSGEIELPDETEVTDDVPIPRRRS